MRCESMKKFCYIGLLRNYLKSSTLIEKYPDLTIPSGMLIEDIITRFGTLYRIERSMCDDKSRQYLLVGTCIIVMINGPDDAQTSLVTLVKNVLSLVDCKNPISVNGHVEFLLGELGKLKADTKIHLLNLSKGLMSITKKATPMAVCLLWVVVGRIQNMEITMHRYREFEELATSLSWQPRYQLCDLEPDTRDELEMLLQSINLMLETLMLGNNDELKKFGYPDHFFQMRGIDVESMVAWATFLKNDIGTKLSRNGKIKNGIIEMLSNLDRVLQEAPKLAEIKEPELEDVLPSLPVDTYSDLDD